MSTQAPQREQTPAGQLQPPAQDRAPQTSSLDIRGPYDLREVALLSFGPRNERSFDGVMRLAFCVDHDYERAVGVEVRQDASRLELTVRSRGPALTAEEMTTVGEQVARVLSVDADGAAFTATCEADPGLRRLIQSAPGFRPALFYSPYEAALWSIISARRARPQGIAARQRLAAAYGTTFELAGVSTSAVPTPSALLALEEVPGLPRDRIPRLHAVAEAARRGRLSPTRLRRMPPEEAMAELQQLPGIGPFYASLILIRASGVTDVLPSQESQLSAAMQTLYGLEAELSAAEFVDFAERWRPWRTWAAVAVRALTPRLTINGQTS